MMEPGLLSFALPAAVAVVGALYAVFARRSYERALRREHG